MHKTVSVFDFWQGQLCNSRTDEMNDLLQFGKEIKVFLQIVYDENNLRTIVLEHSPTQAIPRHYNIKPDLEDLEFANKCSYDLSRISQLVIRKTGV